MCVSYEGIPARSGTRCSAPAIYAARSALARGIEFDLKRRLWMAREVPDDHIVWPFVTVGAVTTQVRDWGVPLEWREPDELAGGKAGRGAVRRWH